MKLKTACLLAEAQGLDTVGEALLNIEIHHSAYFRTENEKEEMNELETEAQEYKVNTPIWKVLKEGMENDGRTGNRNREAGELCHVS